MRLLLDTHAFIWAASDSPRLSDRARGLIEDPDCDLVVSSVVATEIAIKSARGRLELPDEPSVWVPTRILAFGAHELPITVAHAMLGGALPRHHADPWDRLLIAQAILEQLAILTADPLFARYDVETVW